MIELRLTVGTFSRSASALLLSLVAIPCLAQSSNRYAVFLQDPPVSARFRTRPEMESAPGRAYLQQIEARQQQLLQELSSRNFTVAGSVSTLLNAVFVAATPDRVAELESLPGVLAVRPLRRGKKHLNKATQLMNAPVAWNNLGGAGNAGKGIKIAILDTGIDQTHPAFQDSSLTMPAGFPLCTAGHPEDCAYTNSKVIVARSYVRMIAAGTGPADSMPDDFSPRDHDGHGTAVASIAAGNPNTGSLAVSGIAPKAYLGNYKIYGSDGVNDFPTEDVWIKAIEDAHNDGMDVANFSSGILALTGATDTGPACGLPAGTPCDPLAAAFEAAAKAGMVIAVSAGNDGVNFSSAATFPQFNSISSPATAPSVITAGATLNSHVLEPAVSVLGSNVPSGLVGIPAEFGDSFFFPSLLGANQAPLVDVAQLGDNGFACAALPANSLAGAFALIQSDPASKTCDPATAADSAQLSGAVGIVFYMSTTAAPVNPEGLQFGGPVVMISHSDGVALKNFIDANAGRSVLIDAAGREQSLAIYSQTWGIVPAVTANQLASFSSFGPAPDGSLKPDLVATGGFDSALFPDLNDFSLATPAGFYAASQNYDPGGFLYSANRYAAADGTSFSAPLVAGAAALVKQAHPGYTASQIKSALVNSASATVLTDDFGDTVDVQSFGAGLLDAGAASSTTVTAEPSSLSFGFLTPTGLPFSPFNQLPLTKSITVTNKGSAAVKLAVSIAENTPVATTTIAADSPSLSISAGSSATLKVTLSGKLPVPGEYSGFVTLTGAAVPVRVPYLYLVGDGVANNITPVAGGGLGGPSQDEGEAVIQVVDQFGVPIAGTPVSFTVSPRRGATLQSVPGQPACTPASSTTTAVCNTDNYGNAHAEVILGSNPSSIGVTASSGGSQTQVFYDIVTPPVLTAAGVVNSASFTAPVAPGSYITIYGQNVLDAANLVNLSGDAATPLATGALPLTLDSASVSFDVPSAGISVPGFMIFATASQLNVQVPWELENQKSAQVKVTVDAGFSLTGGVRSNVVTVPLANYTPAFFESAPGIAAALDGSYRVISSSNGVASGQVAHLYANGLGPVTNTPASGDPAQGAPLLSATTTTPVVKIGNQQAQVLFSGLAPGFAGLYQVDVLVPAGLSAGSQPLTLTIGGAATPASSVTVK